MGDLAGSFPGTKFMVPRGPVGLVARPRLVADLADEVLAVPLTLLSAPAGYGKTVVATLLAGRLTGARMGWVSIDADDNDPWRLVGAMTVALRHAGPAPPDRRREPDGLRRAVNELLNEIAARADDVVVVLDELEALTDSAVHRELGQLVERAPANLHVVAVTRQDPPLALARFRARGMLAERGVPELRFTRAEVVDLVNGRLALDLDPDAVTAIYERTEGWPAGVRLLAASLEPATPARRLVPLPAGNRRVFEFLAEEVFDRQPPELQDFLIRTSVLSRLTVATSAAVSGARHGVDLLGGLDRRGLFVMEQGSEGAEAVYRYHDLFARFLNSRLERWPAEERAQLHRRAATVEPDPAAVAAHLVVADDPVAAADVLASEGGRLMRAGRAASVRDVLDRLPPEQIRARPRLCAIKGELAFASGDLAGARRAFEQAEGGLAGAPDAAERAQARVRLAECVYLQGDVAGGDRLLAAALAGPLDTGSRVRLLLARAQVATNLVDGEPVAEQCLTSALELVEQGDWRTVEVAAANLSAGLAAVRGGMEHLERFCDIARRTLPVEAAAARLQVRFVAAAVEALRGRLREADEVFGGILRGFDAFGGPSPFLAYQVAVGRVLCGQGLLAPPALDPLLAELNRRAEPLAEDHVRTPNRWFLIGRARFLQGRFDAVREARTRMIEAGPSGPFVGEVNRLVLDGLVAFADGDHRAAEHAMLGAVEAEDGLHLVNIFGSVRISLACLYLQLGRVEAALRLTEPALAASARRRMAGPVLFEGRRIMPLLRLSIDRGIQIKVARELMHRMREPTLAVIPIPQTGQQLTAREVQVLGLLRAGLTNSVIAERLRIGEETVKTHVARVLRKLDVPTRAAAAARAHELGIPHPNPPATSASSPTRGTTRRPNRTEA